MSDAIEGEIVNPPISVGLTKHPEETVKLLETAFNYDFNITEACQYARISRETYYTWLGDDEVFARRMDSAQSTPKKLAKEIVIKAIQKGDPQLAIRYLTLRDPDFKPKAEVYNTVEEEDTRNKLKDFFDDIKQYDPSSQSPTADSSVAGNELPETTTDIS